MKITVNGKTREVENGGNLADFISSTLEKSESVIVELNGHIIPRDERQNHDLKDGDAIELIQFIGGG